MNDWVITGDSVEEGTPIRITRRVIVKIEIIRFRDYVSQYYGCLKVERQDNVQVVLLLSY